MTYLWYFAQITMVILFACQNEKEFYSHNRLYKHTHSGLCHFGLYFSGDDKLCFMANEKPVMHTLGYAATHSMYQSREDGETPKARVPRAWHSEWPSWQWLNTHLFPFLTFTFIEWVHTFKSSLPEWRYWVHPAALSFKDLSVDLRPMNQLNWSRLKGDLCSSTQFLHTCLRIVTLTSIKHCPR